MKSELKRALLKKLNFVLIIVVVGLMIINAYYGGWKTALRADSAQDLLNIEDVIFFKKYYGNMNQKGPAYTKPVPLNESAAYIWQMLEQGKQIEQIAESFANDYEISYEEAITDIRQFIHQLGTVTKK